MKNNKVINTALSWILPIALAFTLIQLLEKQIIHTWFDLKIMQLPLPSKILEAYTKNFDLILDNTLVTLKPALIGMILGSLIGYGVALLATVFPSGGFGSLIILTMLNSTPIVALAPVMNRWFVNPFFAKTAVVLIVSMGAMSVNAFRGLNDLPVYSLDLMKSYASSNSKIFLKLRFKNSLHSVFTALKINVSIAMISTIISEFFASETSGLGYMIKYCLRVGNKKAVGWAYIIQSAIVSTIIYFLIVLIEKIVLRWHVSQRKQK